MKLRRITMVCWLVLLVTAVLVVPVSAGKTVTPISFVFNTTIYGECPVWTQTGNVVHWECSFVLDLKSLGADMRLDGAIFTETIKGASLLQHPQFDFGGAGWGAVEGKWRIVTSAPGDTTSGWEGVVSCGPWTDPAKWPNAYIVRYSGTGFGIYKNTRITFSGFSPPGAPVVWQGEISGNVN
jgi:hypothetical protein